MINSVESSAICMLIPSFYPSVGGAERQAQELSKRLTSKGIGVLVLTRRLAGTKKFEVVDQLPVYRTFALNRAAAGCAAVFLLSSFFFLLRNRRTYNIIHVHTLNSPSLVAGLIKWLLRKKVIVKATRSGEGSTLQRLKGSWLGRKRLSFLKKSVDVWVAISSDTQQELVAIGLSPEKVVNIPNGVDTNHLRPISGEDRTQLRADASLPVDALIGIFVGRLIPRKGVDLLLEAWKEISAVHPNTYLLIVGTGEEANRLQQLIVGHTICHRVRFLGQLQPEEVVKYLQLSDVFILPSESEGLSNALLEAMSVGLAPIATRIGGNTDVINDCDNGLLFEVGDKAGLIEALARCLRDKALRERIGARARRTIEERFSLGAVSEQYVELYQRLIRARKEEASAGGYIQAFRKTRNKEYLELYYSQASYKKIYARPKPKWLKKFAIMTRLMGLSEGDKVLDVGCASQMFRPYVEAVGAIYKGLDVAESFAPDYICDAEDMSIIEDGSFDWVILSDILEHLPNSAAALKEAQRIGENVIAVVPNWYRLERFAFLPRHPHDRHLVRFSPQGWIEQFERVGFEIVHLQGFFYLPSIAFYPIMPLKIIDRLFRTAPFRKLSDVIDNHFADWPVIKFCGQELIIVGRRRDNAGYGG